MELKIYYGILDKERKSILDRLKVFKSRFYLAGGTALALQIGHRDSVDFDYFTDKDFDSIKLFQEIENLFSEYTIEQTQNVKNTLTLVLNNKIKMSFFKLPYSNVLPVLDTEYFDLLPEKEIGVMKISALLRATYRDYVDLYYILRKYSLDELFDLAKQKHKNFDEGIYLKCLMSYDDVEITPIKFKQGYSINQKKVFETIESKVKRYLAGLKPVF